MTQQLYYEDAYIKEFDAKVICCRKAENGYEVTLDRTAFYPEGGGQPCDLGTLTPSENASRIATTIQPADASPTADTVQPAGALPTADTTQPAGASPLVDAVPAVSVLDVQNDDGEIIHLCDAPLSEGSVVHGRLDWQRRIKNMREHSGEHILSGIICRNHGYSNIGFHMGKDCVTIDFSGRLTQEDIATAEAAANEKVLENVEILAEYPDAEMLQNLDYRSKKEIEGAIRIVTIPGADVCACCGTHVKRTGEIGPIKVISSEHFKSGSRLNILIGQPALEDYAQRFENTGKISTLLSVKPENTANAVEKLLESMNALKIEYGTLKMQLLEQKAETIAPGEKSVILFEQGLTPTDVRKLADRLQEKAQLAAVFCGNDTDGYKYVICSKALDVVSFGKSFNQALNGRGGGKNPMIQGSVTASRHEIEEYFSRKYSDTPWANSRSLSEIPG